jgi:hypothetical protein
MPLAPVAARGAGKGIPAMVGAALAVCALWPALAWYAERANHNPDPVALGDVAVSWPQVASFADWKPAYMQPDVALTRSYRRDSTPVALTLLYYRNQDRSKQLISSINRLAAYKDSWHETASEMHTETAAGRAAEASPCWCGAGCASADMTRPATPLASSTRPDRRRCCAATMARR